MPQTSKMLPYIFWFNFTILEYVVLSYASTYGGNLSKNEQIMEMTPSENVDKVEDKKDEED